MKPRIIAVLTGVALSAATSFAAPPELLGSAPATDTLVSVAAVPTTIPPLLMGEHTSTPNTEFLCAPTCNVCQVCPPCGPPGRCWVSIEQIYWNTSGNALPPLITTAPGTNGINDAAVLGGTGTRVVTGNQRLNNDFRPGFRVNAGTWLNCEQTVGLDFNLFALAQSRQSGRAGGGGQPGSQIVARPFFNVTTGLQDSELVSFPNVLSGSATVDSRTDVFGGGINGIKNLCCSPCSRTDLLLGYRYFGVTDDLTIREDLTSLGGINPGRSPVPPGTRFRIEDRFHVENDFHGVNIGISGEKRFHHCYVGYLASVALGVNRSITEISGFTSIVAPPPGQALSGIFPGGLLTQPTNIGRYTRDEFAVLPEAGFRVGCQLTPHVRAYVGYTFIYLSSIQRAGDAINLNINSSQIAPSTTLVGTPSPVFVPKNTDFWAQGIAVGVEGRF